MKSRNIQSKSDTIIITLEKDGRLNKAMLDEQVDLHQKWNREWLVPSLKFISFKDGYLTLLNINGDSSFSLNLSVKDDNLLVTCGCKHNKISICHHAYNALKVIVSTNENYFQKLQSGGLMELAFKYPLYFDKVENKTGIDVIVRPEYNAIYKLNPSVKNFDLTAILTLPGGSFVQPPIPFAAEHIASSETKIVYLFAVEFRNRILPAIFPSTGIAGNNGKFIKTFNGFLSGVHKQNAPLLTSHQKALNDDCLALWKKVELLPGECLSGELVKTHLQQVKQLFGLWQKAFPILRQQPFVYFYLLYGLTEIKGAPRKNRTRQISLSNETPSLCFVLIDKGAFYRLELQFWINDKQLQDCKAVPFFIIENSQVLYMLSSVRDAAICDWLFQFEEALIVFKEHFKEFENEILRPIREFYPIKIRHTKT